MEKVLIATGNIGKFNIYKAVFDQLGIECTNIKEIDINIEVEENGKDEMENAIKKATAYHKATGMSVLANDSGLIIDKFSDEDQPGLTVRRYKGRELTDEEMLEMYINKLNEVGGESSGHYNVALAIIDHNGVLHTKMFAPKRYFLSTPSKIVKRGVPLSSIAFDRKSKKYLSEMTPEERNNYEEGEMQKQKDFITEIFVK